MKYIGKVAFITAIDSIYYGEWGVITSVNQEDDEWFVAIADDKNNSVVFCRCDIRIRRDSDKFLNEVRKVGK